MAEAFERLDGKHKRALVMSHKVGLDWLVRHSQMRTDSATALAHSVNLGLLEAIAFLQWPKPRQSHFLRDLSCDRSYGRSRPMELVLPATR